MKRLFTSKWVIRPLIVLALLISAATIFVINEPARHKVAAVWRDALVWAGLHTGDAGSDSWYWCPMDPQIKRKDANDICPICNMALVPLESIPESTEALVLTPRQVQQTGVVTVPVLRRNLYREVDTTGRLAEDERLSRHVTSWVKGKSRVVKQYVNFVGDHVEKGKLLLELYSPELISAQHEFLIGRKNSSYDSSFAKLSRDKLKYWGMTSKQIDELAGSGKVWDHVPIEATITGTVMKRFVKEGEYVSEGESLYHLADLSHLWLLADVYEDELPLIELKQNAMVSVRSMAGRPFGGEVAFIDQVVRPETRTVRVRFNIDNKDGKLKPGMYARVQLKSVLPEKVAVPENAVLWSGKRTVVLVKQGEGTFQPREVRLGHKWLYSSANETTTVDTKKLDFGSKFIRYHEVLAGLVPGDEVVTAGAFLLNAESQFQNILAKMLPPESESATLAEALGEITAQQMRKVLKAHYQLTTSLIEDELKTVPQNAKRLVEAAQKLIENAKESELLHLYHDARRLADYAQLLAKEPGPKDLKEARVYFGHLSRTMMQLLSNTGGGILLGKELFVFHCGMSRVGYENWVWHNAEIRNPYMGQRMLD